MDAIFLGNDRYIWFSPDGKAWLIGDGPTAINVLPDAAVQLQERLKSLPLNVDSNIHAATDGGARPTEKMYTIPEAAEIRQCSTNTIRRLIEKGRLTAVDNGSGRRHFYLISESELRKPYQPPVHERTVRRRRMRAAPLGPW